MQAALEERHELHLAEAVDAHDTRHGGRKEPLGLELVEDRRPHELELGGRPGQREEARGALAQGEAGRHAARRQGAAALGQPRLLESLLEQRPRVDATAAGDVGEAVLDHAARVGVLDEVSAQRARHCLAREVVVCRAQTAAHDEHVGLAGEQEAQVADEGVQVIGRRQKV